MNVGEIAGAAAAGAVIGGTFGAVGTIGGAGVGLLGMSGAGAASSLAAGQLDPLAEAATNNVVNSFNGQGELSATEIMKNAQDNGFLDPTTMAIDATTGAIAGGAAHVGAATLTKAGQQLGIMSTTFKSNNPLKTIRLRPSGEIYLEAGRQPYIEIPANTLKGLPVIVANQSNQLPTTVGKQIYSQGQKKLEELLAPSDERHPNMP